MSKEKRASLTKKERASAVHAKRRNDPNPERKGKPINVSNFGKGKISESMKNLNEKNVPTSPEKWAQAKSQAKSKFDVYPSAYANGWAAKKYKEMGGGWKSVSEAKDEKEYGYEGDMALNQLATMIRCAEMIKELLKPDTDMPEWVQSKITLATDYIQTAADYMYSEIKEAKEVGDDPTGNEPEPNLSLKKGKTVITNPVTEAMSHQAATTMKHIPNASPDLKKAAKDIKPGIAGYRDRIAMLKAGGVKNEEVEQIDELSSDLLGRYKTGASAHYAKLGAEMSKDRSKVKPNIDKQDKRYSGILKATNKQFDNDMKKEETVQEGRASQRHPLEGHEYHKKSNDALVHIAKDAHAAAEAMKSHNTTEIGRAHV
jgi:hypothetical protein